MRLLLPEPPDDSDVDVAALVAADPRPRPDGRPWVLTNMIGSVDGAATVDGVSGGLGGAGDHEVFVALRAVADVVLAGAGTVRAEHYGPPRTPPELQAQRRARGQEPFPRIAVVTSRLDLDLTRPLFTDSPSRPLIVTGRRPSPEQLAGASEVADVIIAGDEHVDLGEALRQLADRGANVVLCEGGPSIDGQLVAADLLDEANVTVAPVLAGGDSSRIMHGVAPDAPRRLVLDRVLEHEGELMLHYRRRR